MEWTSEELRVLDDVNIRRDAVNSVLRGLAADDGRIDVGDLSRQQIDYVIHLLRDLRACLGVK